MNFKVIWVFAIALAIGVLAAPPRAWAGNTVTLDENGIGTYGTNSLSSTTTVDPLFPAAGNNVLRYQLPFLPRVGDWIISDYQLGDNRDEDLLRFEQIGGTGYVFVYSDTYDGVDALADIGLPPANNYQTVEIRLGETGTEVGWNGVVYQPVVPTPDPLGWGYEPGYNLGDPNGLNPVTYNFTSDVPEPSTIALFGTAVVGLVGYTWRRRR